MILTTWVTASQQNPQMGTLPKDIVVHDAYLEVTQAFDGGSDTISAGYDGDVDAYFTATSVTSTGIKSVTLGAGAVYDSTGRNGVDATYNGGGTPSNGKAVIILFYELLKPTP